MKISTRGRYAVRMMLDLAEHQGDGFIALKDVAARQNISKKYLEQIIPLLNRANMLVTTRGYRGGYRLARKPEDYTMAQILRETEGSLAPVSCLETEKNGCENWENCATLDVWKGLQETIEHYLSNITLQDLLDKRCGKACFGDPKI